MLYILPNMRDIWKSINSYMKELEPQTDHFLEVNCQVVLPETNALLCELGYVMFCWLPCMKRICVDQSII